MADSPPPLPLDAEMLVRETRFVRTLARHLAADPCEADDVAQQTLLLAWERQPSPEAGLRGWLRAVARRVSLHARRAAARRGARERAASLDPVAADPSLIAEELELARAVVDEVGRLAEPYRSTVILRYFHDLAAHEIAARLDVPAATIRSRLKRALDELRARLDARHGEARDRWRATALLFVRRPPMLRIAIAAGFVLTVTTFAILSRPLSSTPGHAIPAEAAENSVRAAPPPPPAPADAFRNPEPGAPTAPRSDPNPSRLVGRLVGVDARRPWSTPVRVRPCDDVAGTAAAIDARAADVIPAEDGTFIVELLRIAAPDRALVACEIVADDPWYLPATQELLLDDGRGFGPAAGSVHDVELRVTPSARIVGRVEGDAGEPVVGAQLLATPARERGAAASVLAALPFAATTDDGGRFALRVPSPGRHRLVAWTPLAEAEPARWSGPARVPALLEVEVRVGSVTELPAIRLASGRVVRGSVRRSDGSPVPDAIVAATPAATPDAPPPTTRMARTAADATFEIGGLETGPCVISVESVGLAPLRGRAQVRREVVLAPNESPRVELVVPSVRLRVAIAREGEPIAGARATFVDADHAPLELAAAATAEWCAEVAPGDSVRVRATAPGCEPRTVAIELPVHGSEWRESIALARSEAAGVLRVQLVGATPESVARAFVSAWRRGAARPARARCVPVADGAFEIADLAAGSWHLEVSPGADANGLHGIHLAEGLDVEIPRSGVVSRTLALRAGARLRLRVRNEDGSVAAAAATLVETGGRELELAWIVASGRGFTVPAAGALGDEVVADRAIAPGRYVLRLAASERPPQELAITLSPLQTLVQDVVLLGR